MTSNLPDDVAALRTPRPDPARAAQRHRLDSDEQVRSFVIEAAGLLRDLHCEDVLVLDLRGLSDMADYLLIASGTSDRQIKSVSHDIEDLAEQAGLTRYGRDADKPTTWVVLDFVDVIVHLFEPATRAHYDLEMLWGDAPRVDWQADAGSG